VEFGYKAQVVDNEDGVVLDHTVECGNPADAPQLAPAVGRVIRRTGRHPRTVTADRGYGDARVENDLHELGVRTVVIPRKGRPGKARQAHEHRRARVPPHRQVAHRQRSTDQHPQTPVLLGSHPP
jgi:IS5 family transposase